MLLQTCREAGSVGGLGFLHQLDATDLYRWKGIGRAAAGWGEGRDRARKDDGTRGNIEQHAVSGIACVCVHAFLLVQVPHEHTPKPPRLATAYAPGHEHL